MWSVDIPRTTDPPLPIVDNLVLLERQVVDITRVEGYFQCGVTAFALCATTQGIISKRLSFHRGTPASELVS